MFTEYTLKLQSVEARCKILEKQLNYMRRMVENSNKERRTVIEKQVFKSLLTKRNYDYEAVTQVINRELL